MSETTFQGWYNRGYLPHFDTDQYPQMITYRLDDSLPKDVVERILAETEDDEPERRTRFEELLDNGHGSCVLEKPELAEIVIENWHYHDGKRYRLQDWVVMPNHAHVAYDRPTVCMKKIVEGWKSYTSNEIKKKLGTFGNGEPLWQAGYHDRFARDEQHFFNMQCYIFLNPVRAGLVDDPFDWPYSSIHKHERFRPSIMRWWKRWKERFWEVETNWRG
jgi:putative DNA methylase